MQNRLSNYFLLHQTHLKSSFLHTYPGKARNVQRLILSTGQKKPLRLMSEGKADSPAVTLPVRCPLLYPMEFPRNNYISFKHRRVSFIFILSQEINAFEMSGNQNRVPNFYSMWYIYTFKWHFSPWYSRKKLDAYTKQLEKTPSSSYNLGPSWLRYAQLAGEALLARVDMPEALSSELSRSVFS